MTAKEFVLTYYPHAKAEKHYAFALLRKRSYYLIRIGNDKMWFSQGETESRAWKQAKQNILDSLNTENNG